MGWLDVLNLAVDIGQSVQLAKVQGQIGSLQVGAIEERIRVQIIEALKNTLFSVNQDLKEIQTRVNEFPKQVYVVSRVLDWRLDIIGITPGVFPALSDKEYAQSVVQGIKDVISQSMQLLDSATVEKADLVAKEICELPELNEWISAINTNSKIRDVEAKLSGIRSVNGKNSLWGILSIIGAMVFCGLSGTGGFGALFGGDGAMGSAVIMIIGVILTMAATIFAIYFFSRTNGGKSKELSKQIEGLKAEMPDDDRIRKYNQTYANLKYQDCIKLRDEKISSIKQFMGEFRGLESAIMLTDG